MADGQHRRLVTVGYSAAFGAVILPLTLAVVADGACLLGLATRLCHHWAGVTGRRPAVGPCPRWLSGERRARRGPGGRTLRRVIQVLGIALMTAGLLVGNSMRSRNRGTGSTSDKDRTSRLPLWLFWIGAVLVVLVDLNRPWTSAEYLRQVRPSWLTLTADQPWILIPWPDRDSQETPRTSGSIANGKSAAPSSSSQTPTARAKIVNTKPDGYQTSIRTWLRSTSRLEGDLPMTSEEGSAESSVIRMTVLHLLLTGPGCQVECS